MFDLSKENQLRKNQILRSCLGWTVVDDIYVD
jgi:hypothetical protein